MANLILHCGASLKTRAEVFEVPLPAETPTYKPLSYESFLTRVEKQLQVEEIKIEHSQLALSKDGQRFFGLMELRVPSVQQDDYALVLGLRSSYDKSFANGIILGQQIVCCDNLSFHSDIKMERKHTAGMLKDLTWMISEVVSTLPARYKRQASALENYKRTPLDDKEAHDLAVRFWDEGVISAIEISRVVREWRTPRFPEFIGQRNAWGLLNASTEIMKQSSDLWNLPRRTTALHRLLDDACASKAINPVEQVITVDA